MITDRHLAARHHVVRFPAAATRAGSNLRLDRRLLARLHPRPGALTKLYVCSASFTHLEPLTKRASHADVLDVYVTRDRSRVFVIDFNPFSPRTDPLLFSYPELHELFLAASSSSSSFDPPSSAPTSQPARPPALPTIRVVSPTMDPSAGSAVPRYAHNRYPKDVVDMSEGQSIAEFAKEWMSKVGDAAGFGEAAAGKPEQKVEEKEQSSIATLDGERIGR